MKRVLIIGLDSAIGSALKDELIRQGYCVYGTTRRKELVKQDVFYLDLADVAAFHFNQTVETVYVCAGVTKIAACESNPVDAHRLNVEAPLALARYFLNKGAHVVYLSSTAVFDGKKPKYTPDEQTCPNSVYGAHKAEVERDLLGFQGWISIVRLTKVLTPNYSLILQWMNALKKGEKIEPIRDLSFCPISIYLVVRCLRIIGEQRLTGIIHLSGEEDVSYLTLAHYLAAQLGVNQSLIESRSMLESNVVIGGASRYTSLDMAESRQMFDIQNNSLELVIQDLYFSGISES